MARTVDAKRDSGIRLTKSRLKALGPLQIEVSMTELSSPMVMSKIRIVIHANNPLRTGSA